MGRGVHKPKSCSLCERRHHAKGFCHSHYNQQYPKKSPGSTPVVRALPVALKSTMDYDDYWLWVKKELNLV